MKKAKPYVISILTALGVGGLSALLTAGNMDIYKEIAKPPLSPPSILFPIVWTVLYVLMGISAAIIYNIEQPIESTKKEKALYAYGLSLLANFAWSIIFFNLRSFLFAFIWLILLLTLIIITIIEYHKLNRAAAYLQIPYALWGAFAGYLNLGIFLLNR